MKRFGMALGSALVALAGCSDVINLDPVDDTPPIEARVRPKPISGGTLVVTQDRLAVAADPDRDLVHVVELRDRTVRHTIALDPGDEPGRVVEGSEGLAHVVVRGYGGVITIDLAEGTVLARHRLCTDPRGIAFDASASTLHVACADGTLLQLAEASGEVLDRTMLDPDLRDVVVVDGAVYASRLRSASIVGEGGIRLTLPDMLGMKARVAWRTWSDEAGNILILHQLHDASPVPVDVDPEEAESGNLPYGGGGAFCGPSIANPAITVVGDQIVTTPILGGALTVDAAMSASGETVALAMPGAPDGQTLGFTFFGGCGPFSPPGSEDGQFTAVAFGPNDTLVAQSREPAQLLVMEQPPFGSFSIIPLEGESRFDTGHEIFHRNTESGLSCATCHPEGTDDGFVWNFEKLGPRRTQPLDIGLEGTAPFHWDGDMDDLDMIMERILSHRMGGKRQSSARQASFESWMFAQERPPVGEGHDDATLVADGQALYSSYGCGSCHSGPKLGGATSERIGDLVLQVPSLRRVSMRPPYMHDGRARTLDDAVRDMIVTTTPTTNPPQEDIEAISAYLRTL
jgi:mono/diheme cytochrome c family protein